ncbi:MAG: PVC-type heme-binding CxxCH protein, partial [Verrucomicrobiota bacterium]
MSRIIIPSLLVLGVSSTLLAQNGLRDIPDTAHEAQLNAFSLPEGVSINLFAHEPAVKNPVHMNWDERGRLWVVSSPLYPHIQPGEEDNDRIVILEDEDGDGVAEKHTVFADSLHIPTAILPGDGGCYVANAIEVLFLKDTDGDDVADEKRVVLSGFGTEDTHHLVHTFRYGPEGMIWMNQSIYIHTHLETPYGIRRLLGGGMWHYRPETQRAEVFMKGLINPWGHAFDEWGQSFLTDGAGSEGINFVFPRSVFRTSPGASRTLSGLNPGQPKHCGLEVLSGAHVPEQLQQALAAPDFRGNRINLFQLTDNGSAYTSSQIEDLVSSKHRAFRPIDIKMGPDGAIYIADWYNPIIQHGEVDFRDPRRDKKHGRIWRITFDGRDLLPKLEIETADDGSVIAMALLDEVGWVREQAGKELRTRDPETLLPLLASASAPEQVDGDLFTLRKVWAAQAMNHLDIESVKELLKSENHKARAGALRALYYTAAEVAEAHALASEAVTDPHPQVRLWAVSVLAQLDAPDTVTLALQALEGVEVDEFLDFAIWSICREHADRWTGLTENGNPFATTDQLLFAVRALNKPVAVSILLRGLAGGNFTTDQQITDLTDWISKVGSPADLNAIFEYALAEGTSEVQQDIV